MASSTDIEKLLTKTSENKLINFEKELRIETFLKIFKN